MEQIIKTLFAISHFNKHVYSKFPQDINFWIAGGAIRSYFENNKYPKDYDLYVSCQEDYDKLVAFFGSKNIKPTWESDNAINFIYKYESFDVCKRFFASPQDTINNFDFTAVSAAIDRNKFYRHPNFKRDVKKRQLVINELQDSIGTFTRVSKYIKRGYTISENELDKLKHRNNKNILTFKAHDGAYYGKMIDMVSFGYKMMHFYNRIDKTEEYTYCYKPITKQEYYSKLK